MKKSTNILFLIAIFVIFSNTAQSKNTPKPFSGGLSFIENNGQLKDQYGNDRADIKYSLQGQGMTVFIGNGHLYYQFSKIDRVDNKDHIYSSHTDYDELKGSHIPDSLQAVIKTYRMEVELVGANKNPVIITGAPQSYYENYYLDRGPVAGIRAKTYNKITFKNVYPGIDWLMYIKNNKLEHEFVVSPGADAYKIRLKYNGQTSLKINENGSITATTPMGMINEHAPVCFHADGSIASSSFRLNNNILSYNVDTHGVAVIDPAVEWATYYGPDSSTTQFYAVTSDNTANIYACGLTWSGNASAIATSGGYQSTFGGGTDGYLVKFDSSGNRLWGTYYGGSGDDWSIGVSCDTNGNIYMGGTTNSTSGISTPGCQQPTYGGGLWDGFLVKFTASGARQWGTYLGGSGINYNGSVCCDLYGHVYVAGVTNDNNNIATPGSFHPAKAGGYDDYLVQYDSAGVRQWGTYYGGASAEFGGVVCSDGTYMYITGYTSSDTGIATTLSYQPAFAGGTDAFLAKFDQAGNRLWGTYFGGPSSEETGGITYSNYGYIYLLGITSSDSGIATHGASQTILGGANDGFLAKFDLEIGTLVWATYYGEGPGDETATDSRIICDNFDDVFITGLTNSTSGIASPGALQTTYGGGDYDAFIAEYNGAGAQLWSTYYGGSGSDHGVACGYDGRSLYVCGLTNSTDQIATPGSFLDFGGGLTSYYQGFLAKFSVCYLPDPGTINGNGFVCKDSTIILTDSIPGGVWSISDTSIATITGGTGTLKGKIVGVDTVIYTVPGTCNSAATKRIIYISNGCLTGINNIQVLPDNITIYPNPATDEITISASVTINKVLISNMIGQEFFNGIYNGNSVVISLSQLPPGIYMVKVNESYFYKIIKQ